MADDANRDLIEDMLVRLEKEGMAGISIDDLRDAMTAPGAAETVAELMPIEAASVQQGDLAPDFDLPWLPGSGPEGETLRLSSHFGDRPVALIFGSYT